jgi:hypothetical protein
MKALIVMLLLCATVFGLVVGDGQAAPLTQENGKKLNREDAHYDWEKDYFREINKRAKQANLKSLRKLALPSGDIEVRVWIGFGAVELEGIILKRSRGQWSGLRILPVGEDHPRQESLQELPAPKSGWEHFWKLLTDEGLLTLPDSSQLQGEIRTVEGQSYVVETNTSGSYRTYKYGNPHIQRWPEARQMIEIIKIIFDEFNIQRPIPGSGSGK